eukprot:713317-Lingulodinium_polyedra.AAC.1
MLLAATRKTPPKPRPSARPQRMRASTLALDKAGKVVKKAELAASHLAQQVESARGHLQKLLGQQ